MEIERRSDGYCPENREHGQLIALNGKRYCPHRDHDGRAKANPKGEAPRTQAWFPR
jgi:hypothetical protein